MSRDLHQAVEHLRAATSLLNKKVDEAAATVRAVENFLNDECSVGISASVLVSSGTDEAAGASFGTSLTYQRVGQRYRIAVVHWTDPGPEDDDTATAWSDCSREIKLATIRMLPDLLIEIARQLDRHIEEAQLAIAAANSVLSAVRSGKQG